MSDDLVQRLVMDTEPFSAGAERSAHIASDLQGHLTHVATEIAAAFGIGFGIDKAIERH